MILHEKKLYIAVTMESSCHLPSSVTINLGASTSHLASPVTLSGVCDCLGTRRLPNRQLAALQAGGARGGKAFLLRSTVLSSGSCQICSVRFGKEKPLNKECDILSTNLLFLLNTEVVCARAETSQGTKASFTPLPDPGEQWICDLSRKQC